MPPTRIERPNGSADFFIVLFHDPVEIAGKSGRITNHLAETFVAWAPGCPQLYGSQDHPFTHSWIHCRGTRVAEALCRARIPLGRPLSMAPAASFAQSLLEIHHELSAFSKPDAVLVGNLIENIFRKIARAENHPASEQRIPPALLAVREFIIGAPAHPVTLSELARLAGMSVPHFAARFQSSFGVSPIECLIRHRLAHASRLLGDCSLSIAQIAALSGYSDPLHFSKSFRARFGFSPRVYRARASGKDRS
jgi:AraC-like DNA-binding protein